MSKKDARIINLPSRIAFALLIAAATALAFYMVFLQRDDIRTSDKYGYLMKHSDYNNLKMGEARTQIEKRYPKPVGKENKAESVGTFYTPCTYYIAFEGTTKQLKTSKKLWGGLPDRTYRLCYIEDGDTGTDELSSKTVVGRWKAKALDTPPLTNLTGGKTLADNDITRVEYDSIVPGMDRKEVRQILGDPIPAFCDGYRDEKNENKGYSICYDKHGLVTSTKPL